MIYRLLAKFNDDFGLLVFVIYLCLFILTFLLVFLMLFRLKIIPNATDRSSDTQRVSHLRGVELPWTDEQFLTIFLYLFVSLGLYFYY